MKIQTKDLTERALDWAVLQIEVAEGRLTIDPEDHTSGLHYVKGGTVFGVGFIREHESPLPSTGKRYVYHGPSCGSFEPSTDWAWGGPLIDHYDIDVLRDGDEFGARLGRMARHPQRDVMCWFTQRGPAKLTAAMRCLVESKLGSEVDVPEELLA